MLSASSPTTDATVTPSPSPPAGSDPSATSPTLSFIIPTIGRPTLGPLIDLLKRESAPRDEIIIVGDGRVLAARGYASDPDPRIRYFELPGGHAGCPQRDAALRIARGDFIVYADDDDNFIPGAIPNIIRPTLALNPTRPHLFRIPGVRAATNPPTIGNVCGAEFIHPNDPSRTSHWEHPEAEPYGYNCDWFFIRDTLAFYPEGPVYINRCIYLIEPDKNWLPHQLATRSIADPYVYADVPSRYDRLNALLDSFDQEDLDANEAQTIRTQAGEHLRDRLSRSLRGIPQPQQ